MVYSTLFPHIICLVNILQLPARIFAWLSHYWLQKADMRIC